MAFTVKIEGLLSKLSLKIFNPIQRNLIALPPTCGYRSDGSPYSVYPFLLYFLYSLGSPYNIDLFGLSSPPL